MRNHSDDPNVWDSEAGYMPMGGLGADTTAAPANATPSWWQNLLTTAGQTYATVKQAQAAGKPPAVAAPAPVMSSGISSNTLLIGAAVGLGALLLFSVGRRKRR